MQKASAIAILIVFLLASPVFAAPGNGKSDEARDNRGSEVAAEKKAEHQPVLPSAVPTHPPVEDVLSVVDEQTPSVTVTPTIETEKKQKVHQKKSTVPAGRQVQGASVSAEECDPAAQWKNHGAYVSCVAKTHPGGQVVSAAARSDIGKKQTTITPSVSPSVSPTVTVSPTPPVTSPETELMLAESPLQKFINAIGRLIQDLPFLPKNT